MIKELKKELSALSGVDFFNPKFREVFKRYFPNDNEEVTAEEERLNEMVEEPVVETAEEVVEEPKAEEIVEDTQPTEEQSTEEVVEDKVEDTAEEVAEPTTEEEPKAEEVVEMVEEKVEEPIDDHKELIDTKVELELVKAGVREDRLASAKKLLIDEIKTMEDIDKVKEMIKQYPEWLNKERPVAKPIGMVLDNAGDGLTEEEKKLKQMGIDPR
jgi:uncharacterized protein with von Willebrand factor type A (vWA) domain